MPEPGPAAVFVNASPHVEIGRDDVDGFASVRAKHEGAPARSLWAALGSVDPGLVDVEVAEGNAGLACDEVGGDRRGPGAVGRGSVMFCSSFKRQPPLPNRSTRLRPAADHTPSHPSRMRSGYCNGPRLRGWPAQSCSLGKRQGNRRTSSSSFDHCTKPQVIARAAATSTLLHDRALATEALLSLTWDHPHMPRAIVCRRARNGAMSRSAASRARSRSSSRSGPGRVSLLRLRSHRLVESLHRG